MHNDVNIDEMQLATDMIEEFEESCKKRERKGLLRERVTLLESQYADYKLVRGFYTLLERRCVFSSVSSTIARSIGSNARNNNNNINSDNNAAIATVNPIIIRRHLFQESSKRGFALTDFERQEIIRTIASRMIISADDLEENMWSDLDENMVLEQFETLSPEQLIAWYNLSLMQTLLFNCTKLEFRVHGGSNWKRVLRNVKRLGLMYNLQYQKQPKVNFQLDGNGSSTTNIAADRYAAIEENSTVINCSVDGPLSIFKLTDRYGTSIAKLLPSIISTETWSLKAWIMKKTMSSGKKIYEFEVSNIEAPSLAGAPYYDRENNNKDKEGFSVFTGISTPYFDSSVEEKFASKFEQFANGWKLVREPDPLIASNGKALIADFMFEKYGRRIYLEIVGFWTKEYLERKIQKIEEVTTTMSTNNKIDFLIAINNDYYSTPNSYNGREKITSSKLSVFIDKNHLIVYKNDKVPLKPILDYLKSIDVEMVEKFASSNYNDLLIKLDYIMTNNNSIVSIDEIARECNIPIESALRIIRSEEMKKKNNDSNKYIIANTYLILKAKAKELELLLGEITKFEDACSVLKENGMPESCYVDLISKLGFDIIWKGIDYSNATIERKKI
jgi:predicted nuclease of restriction endonuclease-like RecB superfamily